MSTLGSDFLSSSTSNQFQHYSDSLFSPSNVDKQRQIAQIRQAQHRQNQNLLRQQKLSGHLDQPAKSPSNSPTPLCFSPDNVARNFSQSTPEKTALSPSPPSPADSGVVTDSKSESGNVSQESLQTFDQNKLEDNLDLMVGSKSPPVGGLNFGASLPVSTGHSNSLSFQTDDIIHSVNNLSIDSSKHNLLPEVSLGLTSSDINENSVSLNENIAAIWSSPTATLTNQETSFSANASMEEAMLQALQQQQQLNNWSSQLPNNFSGLTNPPPGLGHSAMIQKQLQQQSQAAQLQAMQQLALRKSQSNTMTQPNLFNRSTSYQPDFMGGVGGLNSTKLNGSLTNSKSPSLSSWGNNQAPLSNTWQPPNGRSTSLFNSLHHSSGLLNGSSAFRKQSLASQMVPPPRLNRSISTPAKYSSYMSSPGLATSLDDNPFFKVPDAASSNGLLSLSENTDSMGFSNIESQLFDIMRSNDNQQFGNQNLARTAGKWTDLNSDILFEENPFGSITSSLAGNMTSLLGGEYPRDRFSRKVFVGGLPPDIDEEEIQASFRHFGPLVVDWPHKAESKSYFPPKGYAFLLFQDEMSVQNLISCCLRDGDKLYLRVSSPTIREKPVQIRPWNLADSDFVLDGSQPLDPRKTIFVGGVPRPLRAVELAMIMDRLYGGVCYAGIDVDPDLKYPKGAGRVAFSNQQSYIAAISARFVQLQHGDIDKRVEVKPYVLDDQHCDECQGSRCAGKFAPFFCANVSCLQYYCEHCWGVIHARPGREFHKPLVKEGADRSSRSMSYRW